MKLFYILLILPFIKLQAQVQENPKAYLECEASVVPLKIGKLSIQLPEFSIVIFGERPKTLASIDTICGINVSPEEKLLKCQYGSVTDNEALWGAITCERFDRQPSSGPESIPPSLSFNVNLVKKTGSFFCDFPSYINRTIYSLNNCSLISLE